MSSTLYAKREQVKWRSRRGLLELDIFFTRFHEQYLETLTEAQLDDLLDLLTCDDHELWAMVNGSQPCQVDRWQDMVSRLRSSGPNIQQHRES
ncbi:succinate dehydrogenase assembly factor 2 [Uliginosibacterium sp. sgz301328]|uniref:FAD assembly factor SdhE n=1 Tax=Uliginosibacterium sp. sgz301328 TaxID=3243764 RepID=UPI00359D42C1